MSKRLKMILVASTLGYLAGLVSASVFSVVKVMLDPNVQSHGLAGVLLAPVFLFFGNLYWLVIGGAMFAVPQGFVALLVFSFLYRSGSARPPGLFFPVGLIFLVVFGPIFYSGFRNRPVDGIVIGLGVLVGVAVAVRYLMKAGRKIAG